MASSSSLYIHPDHVQSWQQWQNWDDNGVATSNTTVPSGVSELISIFLGIFIFFTEAGVWSVASFALFHLYSWLGHRDGLHHQLQAVFRNVSSSLATAFAVLQLSRTWGWRASWRRTVPVLVVAAALFGLFVVGMPFILAFPLLNGQGDEILIYHPGGCGYWAAAFTTTGATAATLLANQSREAVSYVDLCYNSDAPSNHCDRHLVQRRLSTVDVAAAACPFAADFCLVKNKYPAYKWQTEELDSHIDFGINAGLRDRVKVRRTTTCAPLDVDGFTSVVAGAMRDENITGLYFGPARGHKYTFMVSNYESVAKPAYHLDVVWYYPANGSAWSSTFTPISGLARSDADVSIVSLNNQMMPIKGTDGPCRDPFFSATKKTMPTQKDYYLPDRLMTAIGCTDQYAFGNAMTGQWTKLMAGLDTADWGNFTKDWSLTARQKAAMASLTWSITRSGGIDRVIVGLETEALLAKKVPGVFSGFQNPIPNDQWIKEVGYWFNIGLAKLQLHLVSIAVGPQDRTLPDLQNHLSSLTADSKDLAKIICSSQKVRSTEYKNFHFAGLTTLLVLGGLVAVLGPFAPELVSWKWSVLKWTSYATLQILRMAMEAAGVLVWDRLERDIPVLNPRDAPAGDLDVEPGERGHVHPQWHLVGEQAPLQVDAQDDADPLLGQVTPNAGVPDGEGIALDSLPLRQGE